MSSWHPPQPTPPTPLRPFLPPAKCFYGTTYLKVTLFRAFTFRYALQAPGGPSHSEVTDSCKSRELTKACGIYLEWKQSCFKGTDRELQKQISSQLPCLQEWQCLVSLQFSITSKECSFRETKYDIPHPPSVRWSFAWMNFLPRSLNKRIGTSFPQKPLTAQMLVCKPKSLDWMTASRVRPASSTDNFPKWKLNNFFKPTLRTWLAD